jgi:hypothetical protein
MTRTSGLSGETERSREKRNCLLFHEVVVEEIFSFIFFLVARIGGKDVRIDLGFIGDGMGRAPGVREPVCAEVPHRGRGSRRGGIVGG